MEVHRGMHYASRGRIDTEVEVGVGMYISRIRLPVCLATCST